MPKYSKPFLKEVIVRADFVVPVIELSNNIPLKVRKEVLGTFPIDESRHVVPDLPLGIPLSDSRELTGQAYREWRFTSEDRLKTLAMSQHYLFVTYKQYEGFDVLKADFLSCLKEIMTISSNVQVKRIGLRYINELSFPSDPNLFDWSAYLDSNLLAIFSVPHDVKRTARTFQTLELKYDEFMLRFQYGMHNPDFPSRIRQKMFVLDIDVYRDRIIETYNDAEGILTRFNEEAVALFEKSIEPDLRRIMNERR